MSGEPEEALQAGISDDPFQLKETIDIGLLFLHTEMQTEEDMDECFSMGHDKEENRGKRCIWNAVWAPQATC